MKVRLLLTSVFNVFDLIITMVLVDIYGIGIELNPVGRLLLNNNLILFLYKLGIVGWYLYFIKC